MYKCTKCFCLKNPEFFHVRKDRKKPVASKCIECTKENKKINYIKNIAKHKVTRQKEYLKNKEVIKQKSRSYRLKNKEKCVEMSKFYYIRNKEKIKAKVYEYTQLNKEKKIEYFSQWKKQNSDYMKLWRRKNLHLIRLYGVERAQRTAQATPPWADLDKIEEIYLMACKLTKETGVSHHVDHIIPLSNKLVCGLHVPENLQILTASENFKKSNKFNLNSV